MDDQLVVSKDEDRDHFAARIFKIGQLLTELFNILCAKKQKLRNMHFL